MKDIPDGTIDLILCDPPYGVTACDWDVIIPVEILFQEYKRICKPNAPIVMFGREPFTSCMIYSNVTLFKERLIWKKHKPSNIGNAKYRHMRYTEDICIFGYGVTTYNPQKQTRISDRIRQAQKGNSKQFRTVRKETGEVCFKTEYPPRDWHEFDADFKLPGDILEFPAVVSTSHEKVEHPTQKPVRLLEYLIKTYSNPGETVLDNCMGSGSTGVACVNTERNFIGFELDSDFFQIAKERIEKAQIEQSEKLELV